MTLYGYARVSVREPEDKNLDLQVERLVRAGCSLGNIRAEEASGARNDRGGLLELLDLVVEGDTLVVTHIDRLSRGLTHGLQVIEGLHRAGVEFRYPLETMLELHRQHESVILLDHHETARDALEGRMPDCHFDLERSGVTIAWEYWGSGFSTNEGELLARYIEDRDLWRWKLPDSREVSARAGLPPEEVPSVGPAVRGDPGPGGHGNSAVHPDTGREPGRHGPGAGTGRIPGPRGEHNLVGVCAD